MQNYFQIEGITKNDDNVCYQIALLSDCEVYEGHFPGHPVAPGACSIEMIRRCISMFLEREVRFLKIYQCKFLSPVNPEIQKRILLTLTWKQDIWKAVLMCDDLLLMRLKVAIR
ncbi:MAG: hypothetical protein J5701_07785 [Bacteroidales bacterium]|nr:hypothetical protein [Bacteroidales bacterium]